MRAAQLIESLAAVLPHLQQAFSTLGELAAIEGGETEGPVRIRIGGREAFSLLVELAGDDGRESDQFRPAGGEGRHTLSLRIELEAAGGMMPGDRRGRGGIPQSSTTATHQDC